MIKPEDWEIKEMPDATEVFHSGRELNEQEFTVLSRGLKPNGMDDKWFIYYLKDSIYLHRSWTGHCIFIAQIEKLNGISKIGQVTVNNDRKQFAIQSIETKREMFEKLVDLVLRKS